MNEDNRFVLCQNNVWLSRQIGNMKAKTKPISMKKATNDLFGLRILGRNFAHHIRTLLL